MLHIWNGITDVYCQLERCSNDGEQTELAINTRNKQCKE